MPVAFGEYVYDPVHRELRLNGKPCKIDGKLLQLLGYFVANPGRLLSKHELLESVWEGRAVADNVLSVSVAKLRKVLGHQPGVREYIENYYGRGYRFVQEVREAEALPVQSALPPAAGLPSPPTLIGRDACLQRLEAALARARSGRGGLCLVVGEPGIGKSRLCELVEHNARAGGMATAWGRCLAVESTPPLWPFVQVLRQLRGRSATEQLMRELGEDSARLLASPAMLSQAAIADSVRSSHKTIDAITQALIEVSQARPLLIVIDDLHWADAISLRLLNYFVADLARWPILVLVTQRSTELRSTQPRDRELLRVFAHANCERIELERLGEADVGAYVEQIFDAPHPALARAVWERSEGNPFFMVELLRPFVGAAEPDPEKLQVSGVAIDLVRERLQSLPEAARQVLAAAAVIGHQFDLALLAHVTGLAPAELVQVLDQSLGNVTSVPLSAGVVAGTYVFDHSLIREVLYSELASLRRCQLHKLAAQGLALRRSSGGEVASSELAQHSWLALPSGAVADAIHYAREAAVAATCIGANADARSWLQRGLAALDFSIAPDPEVRSALLIELSIVERMLAAPEYRVHLAQGVALARSLKLGAMLSLAGQFLSPGPGVLAQTDASEVLEAAAEVLPREDRKRRAIVLAHLAWTPPHCHSARRVSALMQEAEELARGSNDPQVLATLRDAQLFFSGPDHFEAAERIAQQIERDLPAQRDASAQWRATSVLVFRLISAGQRGDEAAFQRAVDALSALHMRLNHSELMWHHERLLLIQRMNRGAFAGVAGELWRLRERAKHLRVYAWRGICDSDYASYAAATGDTSGTADASAAPRGVPESESPNARSSRIRVFVERGQLVEAERALAEFSSAHLRDLPRDRDYLAVLADLASAAVATHSREHAATLYELLRPYDAYYATGMSFHNLGSIQHWLGVLAVALEREEEALEHLNRAAVANERAGLRGWVLHTQYHRARLWLGGRRVRDLARGREAMQAVAQMAQELGMRPIEQAALQSARAPAALPTRLIV